MKTRATPRATRARLQPRFNLWLEVDGEVALSSWRAGLLEAVDRLGSISAAAVELGVPYRRAWQKINEMETRLGAEFISTRIGGSHGGGACLTPTARHYLGKFLRYNAEVEQVAQATFRELFGS